jgi:hypothetical protein
MLQYMYTTVCHALVLRSQLHAAAMLVHQLLVFVDVELTTHV